MKSLLSLLLGSGLLLAAGPQKNEKKKIELKIKGPRMVFLPPAGPYEYSSVTVTLTARLEGDPENPEDYYCLSEYWEWGDEERSRYDPDCEPYKPGVELNRHFSATHRFKGPGGYDVVFRLEKGKKTILTAKHSIVVQGG